MNKKVTCRPCKEKPGKWEIEDQNGQVKQEKYATKGECVKTAKEMCEEYGCDLRIEDQIREK